MFVTGVASSAASTTTSRLFVWGLPPFFSLSLFGAIWQDAVAATAQLQADASAIVCQPRSYLICLSTLTALTAITRAFAVHAVNNSASPSLTCEEKIGHTSLFLFYVTK